MMLKKKRGSQPERQPVAPPPLPGGKPELLPQPQNPALLEIRAMLEGAGPTATTVLPALERNWDALVEEGFDSPSALRLAGADDLAAGRGPAEGGGPGL